MKFSTASIFVLANGIAAMPWSGSSKSNAVSTHDDITLQIKVSQHATEKKKPVKVSNYDICLKVCWPQEPTCPEGWHTKNFGSDDEPCWTCCKSPQDDDL